MEEKTAYRAKLSDNEKSLLEILRTVPKSLIRTVIIDRCHTIDYSPRFKSVDKLQILSGYYNECPFIVVSKDTYPLGKCAVSIGTLGQVIRDVQSWIKQDPWLYRGLPAAYKFLLKETEGRF
jgi:hypothetical protein